MRILAATFFCAIIAPAYAATSPADEAAFQRVVAVLKTIKAANRNPDSVVWEEIWANNDASLICIEYRGQNGFGGMNREAITVVKNTVYRTASAWNRNCTKGGLKDMLFARRAL